MSDHAIRSLAVADRHGRIDQRPPARLTGPPRLAGVLTPGAGVAPTPGVPPPTPGAGVAPTPGAPTPGAGVAPTPGAPTPTPGAGVAPTPTPGAGVAPTPGAPTPTPGAGVAPTPRAPTPTLERRVAPGSASAWATRLTSVSEIWPLQIHNAAATPSMRMCFRMRRVIFRPLGACGGIPSRPIKESGQGFLAASYDRETAFMARGTMTLWISHPH